MIRTTLSTKLANQQAAATANLLNNGYIRVYGGIRPADTDTAISTQPLLVELRFANPAFGPPVDGMILANMIADAIVQQTGVATFFRAFEADGMSAVFDGNVGTENANMILASTTLTQNFFVGVQSLVYEVQKEALGF